MHMEPTDAQLPEMVRVQATGFRILFAAATAFLANAVLLDGATGLHTVNREVYDHLVQAANEGAYHHKADVTTAQVGAGLSVKHLRGLWRFQEDQYATLCGPAKRLWLECQPDPANAAAYLTEERHLAALRDAVREITIAEEQFATVLREVTMR